MFHCADCAQLGLQAGSAGLRRQHDMARARVLLGSNCMAARARHGFARRPLSPVTARSLRIDGTGLTSCRMSKPVDRSDRLVDTRASHLTGHPSRGSSCIAQARPPIRFSPRTRQVIAKPEHQRICGAMLTDGYARSDQLLTAPEGVGGLRTKPTMDSLPRVTN